MSKVLSGVMSKKIVSKSHQLSRTLTPKPPAIGSC